MKYYVYLLLICLISCKQNPKSENTADTGDESTVKSEVPALKIYPIEHATAVLKWDELTLYVDPVGGADKFKGFPNPDIILITDIHGDHLNVETLEALDTGKAKIIVPQAVADELPDSFAPQIDVLNNGESKERFGVNIEAIPMYNLREEAKGFHMPGRGNGYVLNKNGMRLYFSGDTEDIPEMRSLQNIDKAFICMNLPYTMTVESAADAVLEFKPSQVYPYHYRGRPDVSDVAKFKELITAGNPEIEVVQLDWYPNVPY
jgi:L-ascorbate metabolism protein UlaG (beta-lactamase superfamily)